MASHRLPVVPRHIVDATNPARAQLDQEPGPAAGSGDAPDEEGERLVFRDEGARRRLSAFSRRVPRYRVFRFDGFI